MKFASHKEVPFSPAEVINLLWVLWLISWFAAAAWSSRTERRPRVALELSHRIIVIFGGWLLFGQHWSRDITLWRLGPETTWAFAAVTFAGLGFTWWARVTLGRLWSSGVTRKTGHSIITNGPYKFVRHPIYTGLTFAVLATAVVRGTGLGCLGAIIIVVGLLVKARIEEQFLRAELGEAQYDAYARRVPMLVPFPRL